MLLRLLLLLHVMIVLLLVLKLIFRLAEGLLVELKELVVIIEVGLGCRYLQYTTMMVDALTLDRADGRLSQCTLDLALLLVCRRTAAVIIVGGAGANTACIISTPTHNWITTVVQQAQFTTR